MRNFFESTIQTDDYCKNNKGNQKDKRAKKSLEWFHPKL